MTHLTQVGCCTVGDAGDDESSIVADVDCIACLRLAWAAGELARQRFVELSMKKLDARPLKKLTKAGRSRFDSLVAHYTRRDERDPGDEDLVR